VPQPHYIDGSVDAPHDILTAVIHARTGDTP
jgi:hypothetical protein